MSREFSENVRGLLDAVAHINGNSLDGAMVGSRVRYTAAHPRYRCLLGTLRERLPHGGFRVLWDDGTENSGDVIMMTLAEPQERTDVA